MAAGFQARTQLIQIRCVLAWLADWLADPLLDQFDTTALDAECNEKIIW